MEPFSLYHAKSSHQKRVATFKMTNGKVLGPVEFTVPAQTTSADGDDFIETLRSDNSVDPFQRATLIVGDLKILGHNMPTEPQTATQTEMVCSPSSSCGQASDNEL